MRGRWGRGRMEDWRNELYLKRPHPTSKAIPLPCSDGWQRLVSLLRGHDTHWLFLSWSLPQLYVLLYFCPSAPGVHEACKVSHGSGCCFELMANARFALCNGISEDADFCEKCGVQMCPAKALFNILTGVFVVPCRRHRLSLRPLWKRVWFCVRESVSVGVILMDYDSTEQGTCGSNLPTSPGLL